MQGDSVEAMQNAKYGSSLTDAQWEYLKPMLPKPAKRGRPRTDLRPVLDAIFYVAKGGIPWRYLPADFPLWQTVYGVFRRWKQGQQWAALNDALRHLVRKDQDCSPQPATHRRRVGQPKRQIRRPWRPGRLLDNAN